MKFDVRMSIDVDEDSNILPVATDMYEEVVVTIIKDMVYDIDDVEILKIEVKQR